MKESRSSEASDREYVINLKLRQLQPIPCHLYAALRYSQLAPLFNHDARKVASFRAMAQPTRKSILLGDTTMVYRCHNSMQVEDLVKSNLSHLLAFVR